MVWSTPLNGYAAIFTNFPPPLELNSSSTAGTSSHWSSSPSHCMLINTLEWENISMSYFSENPHISFLISLAQKLLLQRKRLRSSYCVVEIREVNHHVWVSRSWNQNFNTQGCIQIMVNARVFSPAFRTWIGYSLLQLFNVCTSMENNHWYGRLLFRISIINDNNKKYIFSI